MKILAPDAAVEHLKKYRGEIMRALPPKTRTHFKGILARVQSRMNVVFTDNDQREWMFVVCVSDGVLWIDLAYSRKSNLAFMLPKTLKNLAILAKVNKIAFRTDNERLARLLGRFKAVYSSNDGHWSINVRDI